MKNQETSMPTVSEVQNIQPENIYLSDDTFDVDWTIIPELQDLKAETDAYITHTTHHMQKVMKWKSYIDGDINFALRQNKSKVVKKLIKKSNQWRYTSLEEPFLSNTNLFELDGTTLYDKDVEEMNLILNHQFTKQMDRVDFINRFISTAGDKGTVIVKVNWETRNMTERTKINATEFDEVIHTVVKGTELTEEDIANGVIVVEQNQVTKNAPDLEICRLQDVHFDQSCNGDLDKSRAIVHDVYTTLSDLKSDGRYHNLGNITLGDLDVSILDGSNYSTNTLLSEIAIGDTPRKSVKVSEYWGNYDIDGDGIAEPVIIAWVGDTIIRMEDNPFPLQETPFVLTQYLVEEGSYGSNDVELLMDNQDIMSAIARGTIDTIGRTATGQTITTKGLFDTVNKEKFERGEHCQTNNNKDVVNNVHTVKYPELPQSVEYFTEKLANESDALTGVVGFSQGITGNVLGSTATAVRSATDAVTKRELSILRRLANGLSKLARKVIRLNIEYLSDNEIMDITGFEEVFLKRTQFQSLVFVNIQISTPELNASKAEQLAFMLQTIGSSMGEEVRMMILAKIARLNGIEDLAFQLDAFKPSPDPVAEELGQLEIKLKKAQIQHELARAAKYLSDAGLQSSVKDLKDLEYEKAADGTAVEEQKEIDTNKQDVLL